MSAHLLDPVPQMEIVKQNWIFQERTRQSLSQTRVTPCSSLLVKTYKDDLRKPNFKVKK